MSNGSRRKSAKGKGLRAAGGAKRARGNGEMPRAGSRDGVTVGEMARDAVAARAKALLDLLDGGADIGKPEEIHDVRVASRRFREVVALFRKFVPKKVARKVLDAARDVTRAYGAARSADAGAAFLRGLGAGAWSTAAAALAARLEHQAQEGRRVLARGFGSKNLEELRERADRFTQAVEEAAGALDSVAPRAFARPLVVKRCRRLFRHEAAWDDPANTKALHATRIAAKKLRYALEVFKPLFGPGYEERLDIMKGIQDSLGHYHDVAILLDEAALWEQSGAPATRAAARASWRTLEARLLEERRASHEKFLEILGAWDADSFADYLLDGIAKPGTPTPPVAPLSPRQRRGTPTVGPGAPAS